MVLRYFNLREQPFGVTPDPRFLYAGSTHREALASLLYGIESGLGFVTLTANPGMGKTTLVFEALRRLQETARTVFLFQTISTPVDLVRALLIDLGAKDTNGTLVELQTRLNQLLVEQAATGKRLIVVIDEAQNLDESVLEAVRMLSNFETSRQKLMQIILSGQLQLADKLAQPQLLQLRQRISIFAHLDPFTAAETAAYVQHRLRVAGKYSEAPVFTSSALALIARESQGIPRNINNICFNALTLGCALQRKNIDAEVIREVLKDLDFKRSDAFAIVPTGEAIRGTTEVTSRPANRRGMTKVRALVLFGAISAIVFVFTWVIVQDNRVLSRDNTITAKPKMSEIAPIASSVSSQANPRSESLLPSVAAHEVSVKAPRTVSRQQSNGRLVPVREGQSIYAICVESFGRCPPELFEEIIKMNPSIPDPNIIVSGQRVAIPEPVVNSGDNK